MSVALALPEELLPEPEARRCPWPRADVAEDLTDEVILSSLII